MCISLAGVVGETWLQCCRIETELTRAFHGSGWDEILESTGSMGLAERSKVCQLGHGAAREGRVCGVDHEDIGSVVCSSNFTWLVSSITFLLFHVYSTYINPIFFHPYCLLRCVLHNSYFYT